MKRKIAHAAIALLNVKQEAQYAMHGSIRFTSNKRAFGKKV